MSAAAFFRNTPLAVCLRRQSGGHVFAHPDIVVEAIASPKNVCRRPSSKKTIDEEAQTSDTAQTSDSSQKPEDDQYLVTWDGDDDPANPMNFPTWAKVVFGFQIGLLTFIVTVASSIYTGGMTGVMETFDCGPAVAALGLITFVAGYGVGPVVWGPLSEIPYVGRNLVYMPTLVILAALQVPTALAGNLGTFLSMRFLGGFIGSPVLAVGAGSVVDIFEPQHLPYVLGIWGSMAALGPMLGPLFGGFAYQNHGWRWSIWAILWMTGFTLAFVFCCLPESSADKLLRHKATRIRKQTGDERWKSPSEMKDLLSFNEIGRVYLLRPFEPLVLEPIGLGFFCVFFGIFLGLAFQMWFIRYRYGARWAREGHPPPLEQWLWTMLFGSVCVPISMFWFGWSADARTHWIVPLIGSVPFGFALFLFFQGITTYLAMGYTKHAASVLAANDFLRCSFAAAFPIFTHAMYNNLGVGWASSVPGFISLALIPIPFIFYRYGARIRSWSNPSSDSLLEPFPGGHQGLGGSGGYGDAGGGQEGNGRGIIQGKFKYTPLNTDPTAAPIRLLILEDGAPGDILRCHLYHADLNTKPEYEAVSYSWNRDVLRNRLSVMISMSLPGLDWQEHSVEVASTSPSRLLVCDGRVLMIQPNLYDFLVRLRAQRRGCALWIDAICINQDNTDEQARLEKLSQIMRMGRVYEAAKRVLVWLGESGSYTSTLPGFLKALPAFDRAEYEHFRTQNRLTAQPQSSVSRSVVDIVIKTLDVRDSLWRVLWNLYQRNDFVQQLVQLADREYFRRMWTVQELFFARELVFFAGSVQLSWESVIQAQQIVSAFYMVPDLTQGPLRHRGLFAIPHVVAAREDSRRTGSSPWSLDDVLFLLRDHVATQPEDKVLSILGMLDKSTTEAVTDGVMHNGRARLDLLYFNCAKAIASERGWPYVLTLIATGAAENTDLPSWIPDFRQPLRPKPFWYFGCEEFAAVTGPDWGEAETEAEDSNEDDNEDDDDNSSGDEGSEDEEDNASSVGSSTNSDDSRGASGPAFSVKAGPDWTLTLQLATFDTIIQVGESQTEFDKMQASAMQGHIFDLLNKLGQRYEPTGELTLDALLRTLTADVLGFEPGAVAAYRRFEFNVWLQETFGKVEARMPGTTATYDFLTRLYRRDTQRDTPVINGCDVDIEAVIDTFAATHDSIVYEMATLFDRPETERPWIPEIDEAAEMVEDPDMNKTMLGVGDLTLDNAVDSTVRWLDMRMNGLQNAIDQVYRDRRIFRTKSGYLGSGPKNIRLGDVVCFVAGTQTPFVFRRVGAHQTQDEVPEPADLGKVRIVGEAYVHGVMHQEFVEGLEGSFAEVSVS
ncbi:multidrug resistance [Fusarium albosuccineum]|uniref:Multidrug resistance n=1 Tax=Fusarium albosuccineum TaxID=1237068 RepID=A0A8H4PLN4_9HYPO|nr:multidrug resistance [Fusarium albosuccineum]